MRAWCFRQESAASESSHKKQLCSGWLSFSASATIMDGSRRRCFFRIASSARWAIIAFILNRFPGFQRTVWTIIAFILGPRERFDQTCRNEPRHTLPSQSLPRLPNRNGDSPAFRCRAEQSLPYRTISGRTTQCRAYRNHACQALPSTTTHCIAQLFAPHRACKTVTSIAERHTALDRRAVLISKTPSHPFRSKPQIGRMGHSSMAGIRRCQPRSRRHSRDS